MLVNKVDQWRITRSQSKARTNRYVFKYLRNRVCESMGWSKAQDCQDCSL